MQKLNLNGEWIFKRVGDSEWLKASVPGSVFCDLLSCGLLEDPFYRDNEGPTRELAKNDYIYEREFQVEGNVLNHDNVLLCCDGLDTLAEIVMNGITIARTNNMHRAYEFDIREVLREGNNKITITFFSPINYIQERQKEVQLHGPKDPMTGFPHLRKAHYMFGWDWGPQLPDSGIWKDIYINTYDNARLEDVYVTQKHSNGSVDLDIKVEHRFLTELSHEHAFPEVGIKVNISTPDGEEIINSYKVRRMVNHFRIPISKPQIWWPNGYGEHPLYNVEVILEDSKGILDRRSFTIGLRTVTVKREKDQWGESFEINVNGVSIFAMGADYIPEDNLLPRLSPEKTEKLIKDCARANFNCIRVWGGGIYPHDYFFDLCDKYGILVWQDFMFACATYDVNPEFYDNVYHEAVDNIKRLRHHPSLGLWCGNNEIEGMWIEWDFEKNPDHKAGYLKLFELLLPDTVKRFDPNTFYWPSSPSSGGCFEEPSNFNRGDVHYWAVWGGEPFTCFRNHYFRFASEFGYQSLPLLKTIESFTLPEDRNVFSYVMEKHQKNGSANEKIVSYLSRNYKYPNNLKALVYTSQIIQAEAIKYGVEHWRRNRGRCMGSIYWQLNDCWPVASWSSIDYYGRWKALHYSAKRFHAPVLLSVCEEGSSVRLNICNETMNTARGTVEWKLISDLKGLIRQGSFDFTVEKLSAVYFDTLDFSNHLETMEEKMNTYLEYSLIMEENKVSSSSILFVQPKHFNFLKPDIAFRVREEEDKFTIYLTTTAFAKYIEMDINGYDCIFSDNYFDLSAGDIKTVIVEKQNISGIIALDEFIKRLEVISVYDIDKT